MKNQLRYLCTFSFLFPFDVIIVCTAHRLLNVWSPLEDSQLIRAASSKPWHSLSQQLYGLSLTIEEPSLLFTLEFSLSWACATLLKWCFSFCELTYAMPRKHSFLKVTHFLWVLLLLLPPLQWFLSPGRKENDTSVLFRGGRSAVSYCLDLNELRVCLLPKETSSMAGERCTKLWMKR